MIAMGILAPTLVQANIVETSIEEEIMPLFDHINLMNASMNINKYGIATAMGSVNAIFAPGVGITVSIQQFKNEKWQTIHTWSEKDQYFCTIEKSRAVAKGYSYRTQVNGKVYDENDKVIENVTVYSKSQFY